MELTEEYKHWFTVNWINLIGIGLTLFGVIITIVQIYKLKSLNEATKLAVEETTKKVEKIVSIQNLSICGELIETIQENIRNNKFEVANLRIKDLQDKIIEILEITILPATNTIIQNLQEQQRKLNVDKYEIQRSLIIDNGKSLKKETLIDNLNQMAESISKLKSKNKHRENE